MPSSSNPQRVARHILLHMIVAESPEAFLLLYTFAFWLIFLPFFLAFSSSIFLTRLHLLLLIYSNLL